MSKRNASVDDQKGWMQDAKVLPRWMEFSNFTAIDDRTNEIAHDGDASESAVLL